MPGRSVVPSRMDAQPTAERRTPAWGTPAEVLLTAVWVVGTPLLLIAAAVTAAPFFGEAPTAAELQRADSLLWVAAAVGVGCPALALGLALRWGHRVAALAFGAAAAAGLVGVLVLGASNVQRDPGPAPGPTGPPVCQERSGGDTDCPGG